MNILWEAMRNALIEFHYYCFKQQNVYERFLGIHWIFPKTANKPLVILFGSKSKNQGVNRLHRKRWEPNNHNKEPWSNKQNIFKILSWYWSSIVPVREAEKPRVYWNSCNYSKSSNMLRFFVCFFIKIIIYSQTWVI